VQEIIKELEINMSMKENSLYNLPNEIYCVDMGGGKPSCCITENISPTLTTTHYGEPVVCYVIQKTKPS
jgi:hypothetical protein